MCGRGGERAGPTLMHGYVAAVTVAVHQRIFVPSAFVGAYAAPADHLFHAGEESRSTHGVRSSTAEVSRIGRRRNIFAKKTTATIITPTKQSHRPPHGFRFRLHNAIRRHLASGSSNSNNNKAQPYQRGLLQIMTTTMMINNDRHIGVIVDEKVRTQSLCRSLPYCSLSLCCVCVRVGGCRSLHL